MVTRDWIIAHDATKGRDAYMMECLRCGGVQRFALPISISVYCAAAKAFEKQHAHCQPREQASDAAEQLLAANSTSTAVVLIDAEK